MSKLLIDTNVLGKICHPRKNLAECAWFASAAARHDILLSDVACYELRRELIRINSTTGLARLEELERDFTVIPTTHDVWKEAATLWAAMRKAGKPTAGDESLDGDIIIAAQANMAGAIVVTCNLKHLSLMTTAMNWQSVP